jgi:hypothetical protein
LPSRPDPWTGITLPVHANEYMKLYRAIEERGLVFSFHSAALSRRSA